MAAVLKDDNGEKSGLAFDGFGEGEESAFLGKQAVSL
jgi:hypothetical protein